MIRPEVANISPVSEIELLVFLMDGSGSMNETDTTPDGRSKADHLYDIVHGVLVRLSNSTKKDAFRISFVYFSDRVVVEKHNDVPYFHVTVAIDLLKNPLNVAGGGSTAIADALAEVNMIFDEFSKDEGLPDNKRATVFLFTDGQENVKSKDAVINEANNLTIYPLSPTIATISFGSDADEDLLIKIASNPNDRQIKHLELANILSELPDPKKLFIIGHHADKSIAKRKIEAIRNFVETLSMTRD